MDKAELHRLIDELPESEALPALRFLEYLRDRPHSYPIDGGPYDDEPLSAEDMAALEEARESVRAGHLIPNDEMWKSLGH